MAIKNKNFCIISHIDHGKSTLSDRFLEITKAVPKEKLGERFLDSMSLEKEKGITIKLHPMKMFYKSEGEEFVLNLIDTPGHIDFSYEISRSLNCVEGAVLLVDATKGVQAQTVYNLELAKRAGLKIIGVVNKIDIASEERVENAKKELSQILNQSAKDIFLVSAKSGENVENLLKEIVKKVPFPQIKAETKIVRSLIFDSKYDSFSGVVVFVRVFEGKITTGQKMKLLAQNKEVTVKETGVFVPQERPKKEISSGEIGYVKTGIKETDKVRVGDTLGSFNASPLPGYKEPQPVLFLGFYPDENASFQGLFDSLSKLKLSDPSLNMEMESQSSLGRGVRVGFLGSLQAEITMRRLKEDFNLDIISTSAQTAYKIIFSHSGEEKRAFSPEDWPKEGKFEVEEPFIEVKIMSPVRFFNKVFQVAGNYDLEIKETENIGEDKIIINAETSLREVAGGEFYEALKAATKGFASFAYQPVGFKRADLVKIEFLIGGVAVPAFSRVVGRNRAQKTARDFLLKLKRIIPPRQFSLPLQAKMDGKIIARETIKASRKDVTAPLYGGDITRKKKLLEKQKKGKKKMARRAKIKIPSEIYLKAFKET